MSARERMEQAQAVDALTLGECRQLRCAVRTLANAFQLKPGDVAALLHSAASHEADEQQWPALYAVFTVASGAVQVTERDVTWGRWKAERIET